MFSGLASFFATRQTAPAPSPVQSTKAYTWYPRFRYPYVRLSLLHNANPQVYGHLSRSRISRGLGCLHLDNPSNAYLIYILGPDWRSRLVVPPDHSLNTKSKGRSKVHGYSYIPIPDDDDDEDEHCLRMKRCGARLVVPGDGSDMDEQDRPIQAGERQIFGWPLAGGAWIYRIPPEGLRLDRESYDDDDAWLGAALGVVERGEPEIRALEELQWKIRAQTDMEGVCAVLKHAGAIYYENIEECPEVLDLGL